MTVERPIGVPTDSQLIVGSHGVRPLEYAMMLFAWANLRLTILLHTQLYGSGTTLPNSEPTPCQLKRTQ